MLRSVEQMREHREKRSGKRRTRSKISRKGGKSVMAKAKKEKKAATPDGAAKKVAVALAPFDKAQRKQIMKSANQTLRLAGALNAVAK